jgi:AcrR family transcriptional regulator
MTTELAISSRAEHGKARRDKSRDRLVQAALKIVAEHGPNLTIDQVIAQAGLARGTFYNHFSSVPELLQALVEVLSEEARLDLGQRLSHIADPATQMAASSHYFLQRTRSDPSWAWAVQNIVGLQDSLFSTVPRVFQSMYRRGIALGQFQDRDPLVVNVAVAGILRAAQRHALVEATTSDFDIQVTAIALSVFGLTQDQAQRLARDTVDAANLGAHR